MARKKPASICVSMAMTIVAVASCAVGLGPGFAQTVAADTIEFGGRSSIENSQPVDFQSGELRSGELRSGDLRSGELRSGELRSGELRSGDPTNKPTAALSLQPAGIADDVFPREPAGGGFPLSTEPTKESVASTNTILPLTDDWWFEPNWLGYAPGGSRDWVFDNGGQLSVWGSARALFQKDFRLTFTGQETGFLVEGALLARYSMPVNGWVGSVSSEVFLNQAFDRNILVDYSLRESFSHNFDIDTFEISQLFFTARRGAWAIDLGRFVTPFGRYATPVHSNQRFEAPFIRTESILPYETGLQLRWSGSHWNAALAMTNGGRGRDSNSSKAVISRVGWQSSGFESGASVKWQDGIGSEGQKEYNNHAGLDFRWRRGRFSLNGEWIYDQYGLRKPGFPLDQIDWGRSIYNRQLNRGIDQPLTGQGWYVNAAWQAERCLMVLGYGQFSPEPIGDSIHDQDTRRILTKLVWRFNQNFDGILSATFENEVANAQDGRQRDGTMVMGGLQFNF